MENKKECKSCGYELHGSVFNGECYICHFSTTCLKNEKRNK